MQYFCNFFSLIAIVLVFSHCKSGCKGSITLESAKIYVSPKLVNEEFKDSPLPIVGFMNLYCRIEVDEEYTYNLKEDFSSIIKINDNDSIFRKSAIYDNKIVGNGYDELFLTGDKKEITFTIEFSSVNKNNPLLFFDYFMNNMYSITSEDFEIVVDDTFNSVFFNEKEVINENVLLDLLDKEDLEMSEKNRIKKHLESILNWK